MVALLGSELLGAAHRRPADGGMSLEVDVDHARGSFRLSARFSAAPGLTALFGRSGSGKTTLVDIVGGLIRPDRGRVAVDGQVLVDTERGVFVPKHRRRIGYVFQDSRLFPHLSVRSNLLYGRWFARRRRRGRPTSPRSSTCWASATCSSAGPTRCPAARSSGWRSAAPCSPIRACC